MAKQPRLLTFDEFADELLLENQPRALIILASSQIDLQLRNIIELYLWPSLSKPKDGDELLDGDTPLSTFSSRIKLAKRLGLIDKELCDALNKLRTIRNHAAHWIVFGISDSPLRENLKDLRLMITQRTSYKLSIKKYFGTEDLTEFESLKGMLLTICVLVASVENVVDKLSLRNNKQITLD